MRSFRFISMTSPVFGFIHTPNSCLLTRRHSFLTQRAAASDGAANAFFWNARTDCWRPDASDVERISWGKPAKKKGTGSRGVPHRLDRDERKLYDIARRKGFLEVAGSAWRAQRREAPLLNTFRSYCDARGSPGIVLHKSRDGLEDEVALDLSPLRRPEHFADWTVEIVSRADSPGLVSSSTEEDYLFEEEMTKSDDDPWETRPIYQVPPFVVTWKLPRAEAKRICKVLADMFETSDAAVSSSRKPVGVKPGKNRRSGGYGIG